MDALELLKKDHDDIMDLFASAKDFVEMNKLLERIKAALEAHTYIEETVFYPEYEKYERLRDLVQDAKTQHGLIKDLLYDLESSDGSEFENIFQTLMAQVQLHFVEEQNEIFPQVRSLVGGPDVSELGRQLESEMV